MLYLFCLLFYVHALFGSTNRLIIVYGASCAGKSSLTHALSRALGDPWISIDIDDVVKRARANGTYVADESELAAELLLQKEIEEAFDADQNVVVDTHDPQHTLEAFPSEKPLTVFVYASPASLVERDQRRTATLSRSARQQHWARSWVYDSFANVLTSEPKPDCRLVEQLHSADFTEDPFSYYLNDHTSNLFRPVLLNRCPLAVYNKYPCDILIKSNQQSLQESLEKIVHKRNCTQEK